MRKSGDPAVFNITMDGGSTEINATFVEKDLELTASVREGERATTIVDYNDLINKPSIEGITLINNILLSDLLNGLILDCGTSTTNI